MKWYFFIPLFLQKFIWIPTRLIFHFFGHLQVRGLENLERVNGNVIFAANHASEVDPFLVPCSLPFWSRFSPLFYITREKSFYNTNGWRRHLFGGFFINAWGGYGAKTGLKDYGQSLFVHRGILNDGGSFCIFPEGGITSDGTLQKGKGGIAYLAEYADIPIIPVAFSGTYRTYAKDFFLRRRKIIVQFGEPIFQEELKQKIDRSKLGAAVYKDEANYIVSKIGELIVTQP